MDAKPTKSSKALIAAIATLVVAISAAAIVLLLVKPKTTEDQTEPTSSNNTTSGPSLIDLQFAVDQWADGISGNVGVEIYDIDHGQYVARRSNNRSFTMDSINKLFIALEGYLRIARNQTEKDTEYLPSTTRYQCLDLMLRESNSACADQMLSEFGVTELMEIYAAKGFSRTDLAANTSTASDLVLLWRYYWDHDGLTEDMYNDILDSLINQDDDQRRGLPSGFAVANVYNKPGWYSADGSNWARYSDAALVEFPALNHHYIVAVMTENVSPREIVNLGRNIENAILVADGVKER